MAQWLMTVALKSDEQGSIPRTQVKACACIPSASALTCKVPGLQVNGSAEPQVRESTQK